IFYLDLKFSNDELDQYIEECISQDTAHKADSRIMQICGKLVKYLRTDYNKQNKDYLKEHHCNLLSLWIYEELFDYFPGKSINVLITYAELKLILSGVFTGQNEVHNCLRDLSVFSALTNWKESKHLYDYCVDYDEIIRIAGSSYKKCKEYEEHIQKISTIYNEFDRLYIQAYKNENNDFYEKCRGYNPESVMPKLNCQEILLEEEKSSVVPHDPVLSVPTQFSGINSNSTKIIDNVLLGVVATSMTSVLLYKVNKILIKTYQLYKRFNNLFTIRININKYIIYISYYSFIYKFTPLGIRLRNVLGWNKYTLSNLNEGENILFAKTHESFNPHNVEREHYIGYHPA
ncbi:hypothetical protein PCYB_003070, partial [Plasmodium cynomolgi strain B]